MIASGEKKEEYREIKPYWKSRIYNACCKTIENQSFAQNLTELILYDNEVTIDVLFKNGYGKNAPKMKCKCIFDGKGYGKQEWGAEQGKMYYVIRILQVLGDDE